MIRVANANKYAGQYAHYIVIEHFVIGDHRNIATQNKDKPQPEDVPASLHQNYPNNFLDAEIQS